MTKTPSYLYNIQLKRKKSGPLKAMVPEILLKIGGRTKHVSTSLVHNILKDGNALSVHNSTK